ncbi:MAG: hypothetical protein CTY15_14205 [Methylocystis sp.]|nr:MAG: hypothetical protein CTY15_14205 [Methylocystis sp.]
MVAKATFKALPVDCSKFRRQTSPDRTVHLQTSRLAWLDGWRTLAVLLVLLDHLSMNGKIEAFYASHGLRFLADYGEVGVFIFFFISGHVVSRTCLAEVEKSGGFDSAAFYVRRLFRIAPPLMLYLCFCLWLGAQGFIDFSPANFLSAALYLCNTSAPSVSCNWYVGHTWSLAFEEQFYLLFPLVFSWLELRRAPRLLTALLVAGVVSLPLVFTIWWIGKTGFLIAYALFFAGYWSAKHGARLLARLAPWRREALLLSAAIVLTPRAAVAALGDSEAARAMLIDGLRLVDIIAVPALVTLSGAVDSTRRLLSTAWLSAFGRGTYSIYLWQQLVTGAPFNELDIVPQLLLLAGVIALCLLLYTHWEVKLIELGRRLAGGRMAKLRKALPRTAEIS